MPALTLSVIVPIYNTAEYLYECLDSLRKQTLQSFEVILVDDGSSDGSAEIVDEYAERYPAIFRAVHQKNAGQSRARNVGLDLATGEYVGFADSDDIMHPEMFERLCRAARREGLDHVSCNYRGYVVDEREGTRRFGSIAKGGNCDGTDGLYGRLTVAPPLHIWKRELLDCEGIRFTDARAYEDVAFYYEAIAFVSSTAHIDESLYLRRWRSGSLMTSTAYEGVIGFFDTARSIVSFYIEKGVSASKTTLMYSALLRILLLSHMARCVSLPRKADSYDAASRTIQFIKNELPARSTLKLDKGLLGLYVRHCPLRLAVVAAHVRKEISTLKKTGGGIH